MRPDELADELAGLRINLLETAGGWARCGDQQAGPYGWAPIPRILEGIRAAEGDDHLPTAFDSFHEATHGAWRESPEVVG
jgi:hypothetical protein